MHSCTLSINMDVLISHLTILTTALPAYRFPVLAMLFFHYFYADAGASWCTPHVSYMLSYLFPPLSVERVCLLHPCNICFLLSLHLKTLASKNSGFLETREFEATWIEGPSNSRLPTSSPLTKAQPRYSRATQPSHRSTPSRCRLSLPHPISRVQRLDKGHDARQRMVQPGVCERCDPRHPVL